MTKEKEMNSSSSTYFIRGKKYNNANKIKKNYHLLMVKKKIIPLLSKNNDDIFLT